MGTHSVLPKWIILSAALIFSAALPTRAVVLTVSESEVQPLAGADAAFWLNVLNTSEKETSWIFPGEIKCRITSSEGTIETSARRRAGTSPNPITIAPQSFTRSEYTVAIPAKWIGEVTIEASEVPGTQLTLNVRPAETQADDTPPEQHGMGYFLKGRHHARTAGEYDPDNFFKQHFFGYEPFYFIGGSDSPNAKFQISFKYRLLNDRGWVARNAPLLVGFHLGYTQTSLWDLNAPSAPFYDTSYRPELLYSWDRVVGGGPTNWFRLDLQGGLQHESNGKDTPDSRSINIAYLRPRITFGKETGLQLTLAPRAWVYVADVDDNPDIADYRGYGDLRAVLGWKRGLQVSALGRLGQDWSQGSITVDATYPLMQPPTGSFSIYLHAQYFTGYGESFLGYRERSDVFRAGISLYR